MTIHINQLKRQGSIELSYTDDDILLQQLLDAAIDASLKYCNGGLSGTTEIPKGAEQAIIMFAYHLFLNRNIVSFAQGVEIPLAYKFLLDPYKNYVIV